VLAGWIDLRGGADMNAQHKGGAANRKFSRRTFCALRKSAAQQLKIDPKC